MVRMMITRTGLIIGSNLNCEVKEIIMKTVLFVATDCSNPLRSGYDVAREWADKNRSSDIYITSHQIGARTDAHQNQIDIFAYEVCTENATENLIDLL